MNIDFLELARIEKQTITPDMAEHLQTLNEQVSIGIHILRNLPPNVMNNSRIRVGRVSNGIDVSVSLPLYQAAVVAWKLLDMREQAMQGNLAELEQATSEHMPAHETELQKQLADATLSGDAKAADKAVEGLQRLRQRTAERGEMESRMVAIKSLLDLFRLAREVLSIIQRHISPGLWREYAASLHEAYIQQREQIMAFINLHHQIRACEWMAKDDHRTRSHYVSPLADTIKLFEFDQERHKQALADLSPVVFPE